MDDVIHDCYYEIYNNQPSKEVIHQIKQSLPQHIILLSKEWGGNDTEVVNEVYKWIKLNN